MSQIWEKLPFGERFKELLTSRHTLVCFSLFNLEFIVFLKNIINPWTQHAFKYHNHVSLSKAPSDQWQVLSGRNHVPVCCRNWSQHPYVGLCYGSTLLKYWTITTYSTFSQSPDSSIFPALKLIKMGKEMASAIR